MIELTTHINFDLPTQAQDVQRSHKKKIHNFSIYKKTINCKNSQKVPFGRQKVLYKFPNDIASKLLNLHAVNRWFMCQPQNGQLLEWP